MEDKKWHVLVNHGVSDITALAQQLLHRIPHGTVLEQLRARNIHRITTRKMLLCATLTPTIEGTAWCISLSSLRGEDWAFSVGHELAHTFGFTTKPPFQNNWSRDGSTCEELEDLCDEFSHLWLARGNNRAELEEFLSFTLFFSPKGVNF